MPCHSGRGPGASLPSKPNKAPAKRRAKPRRKRVKPNEAELALAAFAHEIRTSLTGILALSELLVTSGLGEREARWASGVKSTAEHLAALINLTIDSVRAEAQGLCCAGSRSGCPAWLTPWPRR